MVFGKLGNRRRRRLPDCLGKHIILQKCIAQPVFSPLVRWIRDQHPDPDGDYKGYVDVIGKRG